MKKHQKVLDCGGQAMVEMTVGLVAIMVLLSALIQIGDLAYWRSRTMAEAREDAGLLAMSDTYQPPPLERYIYIQNWLKGPDGRFFTHDDVPMTPTGTVSHALQLVGAGSGMTGATEPTNNPFAQMDTGLGNVEDFALVQSRKTENRPVLPLIQRLVYGRESIDVESEAWLVWTEGIY
ncbi:MAG: hypothetical protein ABR497_07925 [Kiritimatiellia bacterium]